MKILVFAALYYPFKGGYVESIHGLFSRLAARGAAVTIVTCNTHAALPYEVIDGVRVIRLACFNPRWLNDTYPLPRVSALARAWRALSRESFDIISTQTRFFPTTWMGFVLGKRRGIPIIHTERGSQHTASPNIVIRWLCAIVDHTLGWLVCRFSDCVIGVSDAARDFARHLGARNPLTIYNAIDVDFWRKKESAGAIAGPLRIVFVGRLIYGKGVHDLLRACALLTTPPLFHLDIVGDGPYRAPLEQTARTLGLEQRVTFWGERSLYDIRSILHAASVFVNPSYSEGLPRSVLEAAAVGVPIIATDVGGTKEIIGCDGGILIEPKNVYALARHITTVFAGTHDHKNLSATQERINIVFAGARMIQRYENTFRYYV